MSFLRFRQGVSFVPVEVLESYLEDLLDSEVTDAKLAIDRESSGPQWVLCSFIGLLIAIAVGVTAASAGVTLVSSVGLTWCLALPFGILWHFAPREGAARRMSFAQLVSREVARRRGGGPRVRDRILSSVLPSELLAQSTPGSACVVFDKKPPRVFPLRGGGCAMSRLV